MLKLLWPTDFGNITQRFGDRPEYYKQYGLPGHEGLDFKAPHGSNIYACADGVVKLVVDSSVAGGNYGVQIRILHENGKYETIYAHLLKPLVKVGDVVQQGDLIGLADSTGNSSGSHLHLTLKDYTGEYATKGYGGTIANPTPFMMKFGDKPMRNLACGNVIQISLSDDEVLAITAKLRPEFMVVTSRPALAQRMITEQGIKVFYRRWPDDGDNPQNFLTDPEGFVSFVAAEAPRGAIITLPNEPGGATPALAAATLRALKFGTANGLTLAFGNFATGNPEPDDWENFREVMEYAYVNKHILALHEYWFPDPVRDYGWHVGRFQKVYEIFGSRVPRIVMTEIGYAHDYDPHKGWYGYIGQEAMATHLRIVHSVYKKFNIAYCVFSFGNWPNNSRQSGTFDVTMSDTIMNTLYGMLGDLPMGVPLPPGSTVFNGEVEKLPGTNTYQNIRSGPNTSYADIGDLKVGDYIIYSEVPSYPSWYWVRVGNVEGWTAKSIGGSPLVIKNIEPTNGYDPLADLRDIRASLDEVISKLEG